MSYIKVINYKEATGKLKAIYNKIKGPNNEIDNVLSIHSLRPHTLVGHMSIYKSTLHHSSNTFPNWFLELLGTYTSYINQCEYCYLHHYTGMKRFLNNDDKAEQLKKHIELGSLQSFLSEKEYAMIDYAYKLTLDITSVNLSLINELRILGYDDGEILEINQVVSYFNYANRTVLGLGVTTSGETLGLSPSNKDDENAWDHK
ncbi:peroxidase-related enzyme [Winogradskyella immobilis]|uniref:Peroxidase-related enzyme n=1 Tax=Winogradskyella immobilis TaxID=2816852 RepID=A0ABS8EQP8_9FLAO|nr:peroxidase-related enzyme [Winogradskyella immobilis]MCC1485536.1 peroxidase-related enzyme [Winogradskyella immobilis]MCG0017628.1 peroxidase-related enzyme [Winogradskyella immobilis]